MSEAQLRTAYLALVDDEIARRAGALGDERAVAVARAQAEVDQMVSAARSNGQRDGARVAARIVAVARRSARAEVLAARREVYDEFRAAALDAVTGLRGSPRHDALVAGLRERLPHRLGPGATLEVDPGGRGGVIAADGRRVIDCSLPALAARCLDEFEPRVERLWQ